jgi:periplasmic divalent cation tolerance protein
MDQIVLLYTTWPDADTAERAARAAVDEGLAACANLLGAGVSIYRWQGAVERAAETVMILKTTAALAPALRDRIVGLHPYDLPAVVALPAAAGASSAAFLSWVAAETGSAVERRNPEDTPGAK